MSKQYTDFLIETSWTPARLDITLQSFTAVLVGGPEYIKQDGYYVARVFGDPGFFKFACERQGYCKIVRELSGSEER